MTDEQRNGLLIDLAASLEREDALKIKLNDLAYALEEIQLLEGTEINEWDAVERVIPKIVEIAGSALAKVGAGGTGDKQ